MTATTLYRIAAALSRLFAAGHAGRRRGSMRATSLEPWRPAEGSRSGRDFVASLGSFS